MNMKTNKLRQFRESIPLSIAEPDDLKDGNRIANTEAFSIEGCKGVK
jgi:hypothetical protein